MLAPRMIEENARGAGQLLALREVSIVASSDHSYRCDATSCRYGFDTKAPEGVALPGEYDTCRVTHAAATGLLV
jgi:hypothetical protein